MKNKTLSAVLVLSIATIMSVLAISPVFAVIANGTYTDHQDAAATAIIEIEGRGKMVMDAFHYDYGSLGSGDVIRVAVIVITSTGAEQALPVAVFTDIPQRMPLFQYIYSRYPTSIQLISDPSAIEVRRCGKSLNIHCVWDVALVVPATTWQTPAGSRTVPGFTVPPGKLFVVGHGDAISGVATEGSVAAGYKQTVTWTGYYGSATFVCPTWDFGGPVGRSEGSFRTAMRTDATVVTIIPYPT